MTLNHLLKCLLHDLRKDPFYVGKRRFLKVLACSIGFRAIILYRFSNYFYKKGRLTLAYYLQRRNMRNNSIDISPSANIGQGLRLLHTSGIVIGAGVTVGNNCTFLHGVTLGVKDVRKPASLLDFPSIGDRVTIATNAQIFGVVKIEDNSFVPANSFIVESLGSASQVDETDLEI